MKLNNNVKDLTGQRFGRLVVIEPTEKRNKKGSVIWSCECDCGNNTEVISSNLTYGHTKSCGCLSKEISSERDSLIDGTDIHFLTREKYKNNKSGHKGVCWNKKAKKWTAQIGFKGKAYHLGYFDNLKDAIDARKAAEEEMFEPMIEKYKEEHE